MSRRGVTVSLTGLGALGVALFGVALASEHFGDMFLYLICVLLGILAISVTIFSKLYYMFSS